MPFIISNSLIYQNTCVTASKFIAHLVNQQILHELIALELLTVLLDEANDDTVEVAVGFMKVMPVCVLVVCVYVYLACTGLQRFVD